MLLQIRGICKTVGGVRAVRKARLEASAGEVHALLGASGSGKSALMKIVCGALQPDAGEMRFEGKPFAPRSVIEAQLSGVCMVFQQPNLAPHLSAEENISLGTEPARYGWIDRKAQQEKARLALARFESLEAIPLHAPAGSLPLGQQRRIEIARALLAQPKMLVLDEPARFFTKRDTFHLFALIRTLAAEGVSVVCIVSDFDEARTIGTRYTILRDGQNVGEGSMADLDEATADRLILGLERSEIYPKLTRRHGRTAMEIKQLSGNAKPERASFKLHEGEIFGLAGLDGAGCRETLRTVFGLDQMRSGEAFVRGQRTNGFKTADLWENGVGMAGEGIMPGRSVADNFALAGIRDFSALGFVSSQRQGDVTIDWMQKLGVVARGPWQEIETLSTSNQRRIAIGRLLRHKARILLLDEPTRGVDTATRNFIYDMLIDLAAGGRAILLASSDFRELLGVCDTLGAMRHGRFIAIRPTAEWSKNELIDAIYGDEEPFQAPQPPTETP